MTDLDLAAALARHTDTDSLCGECCQPWPCDASLAADRIDATPNPVEKPTGSDTAALVKAARAIWPAFVCAFPSWDGECEHGFTPARNCPNQCDDREWDRALAALRTALEATDNDAAHADATALVKAARAVVDFFDGQLLDDVEAGYIAALRSALEATDD